MEKCILENEFVIKDSDPSKAKKILQKYALIHKNNEFLSPKCQEDFLMRFCKDDNFYDLDEMRNISNNYIFHQYLIDNCIRNDECFTNLYDNDFLFEILETYDSNSVAEHFCLVIINIDEIRYKCPNTIDFIFFSFENFQIKFSKKMISMYITNKLSIKNIRKISNDTIILSENYTIFKLHIPNINKLSDSNKIEEIYKNIKYEKIFVVDYSPIKFISLPFKNTFFFILNKDLMYLFSIEDDQIIKIKGLYEFPFHPKSGIFLKNSYQILLINDKELHLFEGNQANKFKLLLKRDCIEHLVYIDEFLFGLLNKIEISIHDIRHPEFVIKNIFMGINYSSSCLLDLTYYDPLLKNCSNNENVICLLRIGIMEKEKNDGSLLIVSLYEDLSYTDGVFNYIDNFARVSKFKYDISLLECNYLNKNSAVLFLNTFTENKYIWFNANQVNELKCSIYNIIKYDPIIDLNKDEVELSTTSTTTEKDDIYLDVELYMKQCIKNKILSNNNIDCNSVNNKDEINILNFEDVTYINENEIMNNSNMYNLSMMSKTEYSISRKNSSKDEIDQILEGQLKFYPRKRSNSLFNLTSRNSYKFKIINNRSKFDKLLGNKFDLNNDNKIMESIIDEIQQTDLENLINDENKEFLIPLIEDFKL